MAPKTIGRTYFYLLVTFSIIVLGYSIWMLSGAILSIREDLEGFYYTLLISLMGIILAASSIIQIRRRVLAAGRTGLKVFTVTICDKCDFKSIRDFTVGDYVYQELGKCKQCDGNAYVSQIYEEESKS